jgi:hypothetical protein
MEKRMIIRHDRSDGNSLVKEEQWPALTGFLRGYGAASLIASTWLLSAVVQNIPAGWKE